MASPPDRPSVRPTGPPPKEEQQESTHTRATKPPTRRQTMEVQVAWLETKTEDPTVTQEVTPSAGEVEDGDILEEALEQEATPAETDDFAVPVSRHRPPRLPGSMRTLPPMPILPSKPPPPPRRVTQEVEMNWVEIVENELTEEEIAELEREAAREEAPGEALPDLTPTIEEEKPEITRVEKAPVSTKRAFAERETLRRAAEEAQEGPPLEAEILAARAEADRREGESAERMREEVLAARKRDQDARDREMRQRRKAEREKERQAQEAMAERRAQEKKDEEARASAVREGRPQNQLLDLSGIDDEIDFALDTMLGPNLSYPPPSPLPKSDDDKDKK